MWALPRTWYGPITGTSDTAAAIKVVCRSTKSQENRRYAGALNLRILLFDGDFPGFIHQAHISCVFQDQIRISNVNLALCALLPFPICSMTRESGSNSIRGSDICSIVHPRRATNAQDYIVLSCVQQYQIFVLIGGHRPLQYRLPLPTWRIDCSGRDIIYWRYIVRRFYGR